LILKDTLVKNFWYYLKSKTLVAFLISWDKNYLKHKKENYK
jgi:hypothetical protein